MLPTELTLFVLALPTLGLSLSLPAIMNISSTSSSLQGDSVTKRYDEMLLEVPNHNAFISIEYSTSRSSSLNVVDFLSLSAILRAHITQTTRSKGDRAPVPACLDIFTVDSCIITRSWTSAQRPVRRLTYGMLNEAFDVYYTWVRQTGTYFEANLEVHLGSLAIPGPKVGEIMVDTVPEPGTIGQSCSTLHVEGLLATPLAVGDA